MADRGHRKRKDRPRTRGTKTVTGRIVKDGKDLGPITMDVPEVFLECSGSILEPINVRVTIDGHVTVTDCTKEAPK